MFLLEVTLQQAFQSAAVASFVACHFVYGVVDCVKVVGREVWRRTREKRKHHFSMQKLEKAADQ